MRTKCPQTVVFGSSCPFEQRQRLKNGNGGTDNLATERLQKLAPMTRSKAIRYSDGLVLRSSPMFTFVRIVANFFAVSLLMPIYAANAASDDITPTIEVLRFAEDNLIINLDGLLDEDVWMSVPGYDDMIVSTPDDLTVPIYRTDVRYFYTEKGLYLGAKMIQPKETLVERLSSRDAFIIRDSFGITLDTSGQGLYGYWFEVGLGGSVLDGKVAPERQFSSQWDGPWSRGSAALDDGWSAEMFLPWSMMAMPQLTGKRDLGFYVSRQVAHLDETWSVPALPSSQSRFMSALGTLTFEDVQPSRQFALFPYTSITYDEITEEDTYRGGLDVFWRPSTNFQLTATLNPDFGVVESDDVVVNLTAFETYFPEKRLFFVEGNEVFETSPRSRPRGGGNFGSSRQVASTFNPTPTTLLNTRRIGGPPRIDVPDDVTVAGVELGRPTELAGATKLTGQAGGWRYGLLAAFEEDVRRLGERLGSDGEPTGEAVRLEQDGRDFGAARLLYERSGEGRMSIGYLGTVVRLPDDDAIVHGIDTHFRTKNGNFSWDTQLVLSDADGETGQGILMDFRYVQNREVSHFLSLDYLDDKLDISDFGFIRRNDALGFVYGFSNLVTQGLTRLRSKSRNLIVSSEVNGDGKLVRAGLFLRNRWTFLNLNEIRTELDYFPARWDDRNSFGNGTFKTEDRWVAEISIGTDSARSISASAVLGVRQEELGGWTFRAATGVTFKPNDRFSVDLDANYYRRDGWLVYQGGRDFTTFAATEWQPRLALDYFISARQQIRLTMQWAGIRADEQSFWQVPIRPGDLEPFYKATGAASDDFTISRLTAQLRYRWEIGPLSDFFVVYTRGSNLDNRMHDELGSLFHDALTTPVVDVLVIKLRYRFGR